MQLDLLGSSHRFLAYNLRLCMKLVPLHRISLDAGKRLLTLRGRSDFDSLRLARPGHCTRCYETWSITEQLRVHKPVEYHLELWCFQIRIAVGSSISVDWSSNDPEEEFTGHKWIGTLVIPLLSDVEMR